VSIDFLNFLLFFIDYFNSNINIIDFILRIIKIISLGQYYVTF